MILEWYELVALALLGVASGWINVMAGGGSMLTLPAMIFMGIPAPIANGTNRIGILFQNIVAVYGFFRKGIFHWRLSLSLGLSASLGAYFGASLGVRLDGAAFNVMLGVIMALMLVVMMRGKKSKPNTQYDPQNLILGHLCMVGVGFWGGLIQVGVGFLLMPVLNKIMHLDLVHTNAHKVFIVLVYTIVALSVFATELEVLWVAGLALSVGTSIGGYLGTHYSVTRGEGLIKVVMYMTLGVFIAKLFLDALKDLV